MAFLSAIISKKHVEAQLVTLHQNEAQYFWNNALWTDETMGWLPLKHSCRE